ncbi:hypothetical protein F5Y15DRAFT_304110 [Xylariaceae sp. FL0016]|nr:hypothetical protein F5Y15DRAFT_304110 [Xylariaceae sp. FL0016]
MVKSKAGLAASGKAIDPTLNALFTSSSGPIQAPSSTRYSELLPRSERKSTQPNENENSGSSDDEEIDEESLSELDDGDADDSELPEDPASLSDALATSEDAYATHQKERKRKRKDKYDDLEDKYLSKIAQDDAEEEKKRQEKRRKGENGHTLETVASTAAANSVGEEEDKDETPLVHESLRKADEHVDVELDKANRTLFLGNVSSEAITSSKAKKLLIAHLESPLTGLDSATGPHKIESIRFRSVAFSTGAMPKRAAYVTKSLMTATTKSANAYAVYSTQTAAREALKSLNGSTVLDRHIRVDSVAHPTAVDHRRCVFVGNLGFVDDETVFNIDKEGETTKKKRTKIPADTEEGLWRVFGQHAGKVESVRVPRDDNTRVGKGFAYVQFYDGNDVESALLLNGKKFPPMLPRELRVSRAKDPRKTTMAMERTMKTKLESARRTDGKVKSTKHKPKITPDQQTQVGRASRLYGRAGAARQRHELKGEGRLPRGRPEKSRTENDIKPPEQFVFEGRRATANDGKPKDLKFKTKGKKGPGKGRPKSRGARRAAEWRKKGSS